MIYYQCTIHIVPMYYECIIDVLWMYYRSVIYYKYLILVEWHEKTFESCVAGKSTSRLI
jgi:hypothetical protein